MNTVAADCDQMEGEAPAEPRRTRRSALHPARLRVNLNRSRRILPSAEPQSTKSPSRPVNPSTLLRFRLQGWRLAVAALSLGVLAFNLAMAFRAPVWLDEAHTYWVIRDGFQPIFGKLAQDVHPPLYFCLTSWVTSFLGIELWALRFPSVLAAAAAIPVVYWTARAFASRPWAFGAALFVATHPLFDCYGFVARSYGLFLLLLMATLGTVFRAAASGSGRWTWFALAALSVLLLQTDNLAVFVFPPLVVTGALLAGERWRPVGLRLVGVLAIAFAAYLPWFVTAVHAEGGIAWIAGFWAGSIKWLGPIRSLLGFGVGAEYPPYLGPLGAVKSLPIAGAVLTGILLLASLDWPRARPAGGPALGPRPRVAPALWAGMGSLVLLWAYSWIRHPIYLLGRYDLVAFPFAALLLCLGVRSIGERLRRPAAGAALLALCVAINVSGTRQMWTSIDADAPPHEEIVVKFLSARGRGRGDLVITRGHIAFLILRYAFDRAGLNLEFMPYPAAVGVHPGWYDPEIFLRDPARLEADAGRIAQRVAEALADGRRVWLIDDGDTRVDTPLIAALDRIAVIDDANSAPALRVFSFRPR